MFDYPLPTSKKSKNYFCRLLSRTFLYSPTTFAILCSEVSMCRFCLLDMSLIIPYIIVHKKSCKTVCLKHFVFWGMCRFCPLDTSLIIPCIIVHTNSCKTVNLKVCSLITELTQKQADITFISVRNYYRKGYINYCIVLLIMSLYFK